MPGITVWLSLSLATLYLGLCVGLALICAPVPGQEGADLQGPVRGVRGVQEGEAGGGGEEGGAGGEDGQVGGGEGGAGQPHPGQRGRAQVGHLSRLQQWQLS